MHPINDTLLRQCYWHLWTLLNPHLMYGSNYYYPRPHLSNMSKGLSLMKQMRAEGSSRVLAEILISVPALTRATGWFFNASISMQMCSSANVDYLPLAVFFQMTFPLCVMTLFAPLSCLSNIERFFDLKLSSICLNEDVALVHTNRRFPGH